MASTFMSDVYQWLVRRVMRLGWASAFQQRRNRRRKPDIGRLSNHLRRDIGLGSDA